MNKPNHAGLALPRFWATSKGAGSEPKEVYSSNRNIQYRYPNLGVDMGSRDLKW